MVKRSRAKSYASAALGAGKRLYSTFKAANKVHKVVKKALKSHKKKKTHHMPQANEVSPITGWSKTSTVITRGKPKKIYAKLAHAVTDSVVTQGSSSGTNSIGLATISNINKAQWQPAIIQLFATNASATANQPNPYDAGATSLNYKIYIRYFENESWITNQSPGVADLVLYDIIIKQDFATTINPDTFAQTSINADKGPNVSNTAVWPFFEPEHLKHFTDRFRVVRKRRIELGGGRSHRHVFRVNFNAMVGTDKFVTYSDVRGYAIYTLAVWKGMPLDTTAGTTVGTIALEPIKLVWATRNLMNMSLVGMTPESELQGANTLGSVISHLYTQPPFGGPVEDVLTQYTGPPTAGTLTVGGGQA